MKIYFKAENLLIEFYKEKGIGYIRNNLKGNPIIAKKEIDNLKPIILNKTKFNNELNYFWSKTKHSWKFEGVNYRKLDNFELGKNGELINYNWKKLVWHEVDKIYFKQKFLLVHNQGRVFYFEWSYNGYPQGQLYDVKTLLPVKWARPKNCAPIFNEDSKCIV